jgi:hypothetical protein
MVSSFDFLRAPERATAIATLNRQRHLTPSCGGLTPTAERTVGPARISLESLTPSPGIREQYRHLTGMTSHADDVGSWGSKTDIAAVPVSTPPFLRRIVLVRQPTLGPNRVKLCPLEAPSWNGSCLSHGRAALRWP